MQRLLFHLLGVELSEALRPQDLQLAVRLSHLLGNHAGRRLVFTPDLELLVPLMP